MNHLYRAWAVVLTTRTLVTLCSHSLARDRLHLEIEPNALLQKMRNGRLLPMTIEVRGLDAGEIVRMEVLAFLAELSRFEGRP